MAGSVNANRPAPSPARQSAEAASADAQAAAVGAVSPGPSSRWTRRVRWLDAAAGIAKGLPANTDFRISIVNAPGKDAYPISSMTWLLVYHKPVDAAKGKKLVDFLKWMLVDGQKSAAALDYAPLPPAITKQVLAKVATIAVK